MQHLKTIFLGEAINAATDGPDQIRSFPEPDGAPEMRRLQGVVALLMESDCPPATLSDLRAELLEQGLSDKERLLSGSAVMDLLAADILKIAPLNRTLEFHPPQTQHYVDCLNML